MSAERPRLSRDLVSSFAFGTRTDVDVPPADLHALPERVVQFGTGAFLRGFIDYFIDESNRRDEFGGTVVAISSTGSERDTILNEQDGLFTLAMQGTEDGSARQRCRVVASLSRALSAREDWDAVLSLARDPNMRLVVSNTTEVGIRLDESDEFDGEPPRTFPGKLARFLFERALHFDFDASRGVIVLPCELIEDNGATLRAAVVQMAARWGLDRRFVSWLESSTTFCNTLVDRIVPGTPSREVVERLERLLGYRDGLITACEPYGLLAIEGDASLRARLGFAGNDARIVVAPDIRPYRERKVRILNGAHTLAVPVALLAGLETVRDAATDDRVGEFLRRALFDEIVPSLDVPDGEVFARDVLERFANPFIKHALIDITLHGTTKMRVRVVPSIIEFSRRFDRAPASLAFGFAAYLAFMRGDVQAERREAGLAMPDDAEGERIRDAWTSVDTASDASLAGFVDRVCTDVALWQHDLSVVDGFAPAVTEHLVRITRAGIVAALDTHLTEPVST